MSSFDAPAYVIRVRRRLVRVRASGDPRRGLLGCGGLTAYRIALKAAVVYSKRYVAVPAQINFANALRIHRQRTAPLVAQRRIIDRIDFTPNVSLHAAMSCGSVSVSAEVDLSRCFFPLRHVAWSIAAILEDTLQCSIPMCKECLHSPFSTPT